ncbi:MAG TPA: GxxExxY protein [Bacteroidales bacterium]|nr:GxxExxY protein [Bacteroidales bacterium]
MKITKKIVNELSYEIVGCAIEVHKAMGPGLLESVYQSCMQEELTDHGLEFKSQVLLPVFYKGKDVGGKLKLDLLVEDLVIVELKAVDIMLPLFQAQLLSYLRMAEKPKGLLINFHAENIVNQMIPLVTERFALLPDK